VRSAAAAAFALLATTALSGLSVPAAQADESPLRGALSTADVADRTVLVPVPDGVVPRRLVGTARVDSESGAEPRGTLEVLVDGEVADTLPARPRVPLRVPVKRADVDREGFLEVGLRWTRGCAAAGVTATLEDLSLVHGGVERMPLDEADFLGPTVTRVDVVVPRTADDDVLAAALQVVAVLTRHYGDDVAVALNPVDTVLPRTGAGQRVLRLEAADSLSRGLEQRFGLWTLILKGPGEDLVSTVRDALGPEREPLRPETSWTLGDLGVPTALGGWGTSSTTLELPQDLFGSAVDGLDVQLVGSHTAVPSGTLARLDVRLDGSLLESVDLRGEDTAIDLDLDVPAERLRADSTLQVVLTAVPEGGCAAIGTALPMELDLDPDLSTVTAGLGDSDTAGFQRLPASLDGALAVAVRNEGRDRVESAADAATLVAALQRAAALPLAVTLTDPASLVSGETGGILVGADPTDTLAVQAPVRLEEGEVGDLEDTEAFAALQAVTHRGRDLVLLGTWAPDGRPAAGLADELARRTLAGGWGTLQGGALVLGETGPPTTLAPAVPAPPAQEPGEGRNPYAPYFLGVAGLLVLALLVQAGLVIRKDRRLRAARQP
jgi:hypothetical protein